MTKIQIRKVNGVPMGRPCNPHPKQRQIEFEPPIYTVNQDWKEFEQSVTEHEAPGFEEGEAEGFLVWQKFTCKVGGSGPFWLDLDKSDYKLYKSFEHFKQFYANHPRGWGEGIETRQIWRIVPAPEKVEVKAQQVYFIYVYDHLRSWVKCSFNPKEGYQTAEETIPRMKEQAEKYPGKEFTIFGVIVTSPPTH